MLVLPARVDDKINRMTLARAERTDNFSFALKTLMEAVGDAAIDEVFFALKDFPDILNTTWEELETFGLVESLADRYILTGRGWTAALISTGVQKEDAFKERIGILFAAMKGLLGGRRESAIVPFTVLVADTELPAGWVFNIIEGRYLEEVSKRRGAAWSKPGRVVLIPASFDIEPTDLNTLLQDEILKKLEDLEGELEVTREDLGQYKCPYCGSGLSSTGGYPIDEHNDGYYEQFGCGYSTRDGYPERICPTDPQFPKFEDFDLKIEKTTRGEWVCYPMGKTAKAKLLDIGYCPGRTEAEARARVRKRYDWYAGKNNDPIGSCT